MRRETMFTLDQDGTSYHITHRDLGVRQKLRTEGVLRTWQTMTACGIVFRWSQTRARLDISMEWWDEMQEEMCPVCKAAYLIQSMGDL